MDSGNKTAGKTIRCKAAVCREAGQPLIMEEVMVAPPSPHEVRIKIICTSLCFSDISFWRMKHASLPTIFGHEAVGVVESVGEYVDDDVVEGDTVIPVFLPNCENCIDCKSEKSNLCSDVPFKITPWMPRYETSRFTDLNGQPLFHFSNVSSFSEYTVIDKVHVTKIDNVIPPSVACLLSCGVSTGIGASWKTAKVEAGSTIAVFGLGAVGLAVAEGGRLCGAAKIIGVDVNPEKFEIAKKFGVTEFINPRDCGDKSVSQVIQEMTGGGADYCFECVGRASLVQEAYASSRKGWGMTVILGLDKPDSEFKINSLEFLQSKKTITSCLFGGIKPKSDIPTLIKHYLDKKLHLDEFVTHEVKFEEINKAFDLLIKGECIRCVIWMDK